MATNLCDMTHYQQGMSNLIDRVTVATQSNPKGDKAMAMTEKVFPASAISRTGRRYLALCEEDEEGLSILTTGEHGWASAHMAIARKYFGRPVVRTMQISYESNTGEPVSQSTWNIKRGHQFA
ncbi:hypothetical protein ACFPPE_07235 [Agromyces tardus]|uniref:hypothetical protein n=1 Tax=Agromyces tardus TaxID=2583849 RepID=UPI00361E7AC3